MPAPDPNGGSAGAPIFWDVDTQADFMYPGGLLYVPGAEDVVPAIARLTAFAHDHGVRIVASADDHHPGDPELSDSPDFDETFPPHCMHGTPGQRKVAESTLRDALVIDPEAMDAGNLAALIRRHRGDILIHKRRFDVFSNPNVPALLDELRPAAIVVYGVALDVCVRHAIEGLLNLIPTPVIYFVGDASRALNVTLGRRLTDDWVKRGVRPVTTDELVAGSLLREYLPADSHDH